MDSIRIQQGVLNLTSQFDTKLDWQKFRLKEYNIEERKIIVPNNQNNNPLILIVDNDAAMRFLLQQAIEKEGYRVVEASGGQQCLDICQKLVPDLVLLDALIPGIDGFTCCNKLQTHLGNNCPPILMMTVLEDQKSMEQALELGVTDCITKPIHLSLLIQRIRWLIATRQEIENLRQEIKKERLLTKKLKAKNQELLNLARYDSLTKIANRRYFEEYLQHEWKRSQREQLALSLILCDIDFFKAYNDTYGHQAGDRCLRQVANIIKQCVKRPADLVARYGGEEFAVILPNTKATGAFYIANKIQASLKAFAIPHSGAKNNQYITLSLGIASTIPCATSSPSQLITQADVALYQSKSQGRDCINSWETLLLKNRFLLKEA
ncbi:diguanylate cyclase [Scytonema sp. UIC 10036]|uniref:GGDEF domain-containing response regulator n=1 Tax=Scytonema sp. UIC 10036 TaxID=2304196 RepID=UPI0012DA71F8|nr:PleD family two-component system response regulator [Scytonema sp. UIC 10036]MUG99881.1 diguanylate cyclase [Scytonema sp. UIC 10036]